MSLHHQRRQPERWLVEQQQARQAHQRPPDGQHLLLAAAQGAGDLPRRSARIGKIS